MFGTTLRLRRLSHDDLYVLIPMDHGVSIGPAAGLKDMTRAIHAVDAGGATGVVLHKGLVKNYAAAEASAGLLVHISASTMAAPDTNDKRLVADVEELVSLGADGVSVHVNVGSQTEADQLEDLGRITGQAHAMGLPVLAMMYPRGPRVKDPYKPELVAHAARLGEELGADLVKTVYTGSIDSFRDIVQSLSVPLLVAGGERMDDARQALQLVADAIKAGAAGISIGRNVFQHPDPQAMTAALRSIILDGTTADQAHKKLTQAVVR